MVCGFVVYVFFWQAEGARRVLEWWRGREKGDRRQGGGGIGAWPFSENLHHHPAHITTCRHICAGEHGPCPLYTSDAADE